MPLNDGTATCMLDTKPRSIAAAAKLLDAQLTSSDITMTGSLNRIEAARRRLADLISHEEMSSSHAPESDPQGVQDSCGMTLRLDGEA